MDLRKVTGQKTSFPGKGVRSMQKNNLGVCKAGVLQSGMERVNTWVRVRVTELKYVAL